MSDDALERRRARVRRMAAKRLDVKIELSYERCAGARDRLLDLLLDLLDKQRHGGGA